MSKGLVSFFYNIDLLIFTNFKLVLPLPLEKKIRKIIICLKYKPEFTNYFERQIEFFEIGGVHKINTDSDVKWNSTGKFINLLNNFRYRNFYIFI
jgi:hypothetical protein